MSSVTGQLHKSATKGFTLIEMMVTVAILVVLMLVVAPSFTDLLKSNQVGSEVYSLRSMLNKARAEALTTRSFVTVCSSSDGATCSGDWNEGHIAFVDADGDRTVADPNDIFLSSEEGIATLAVNYSSGENLVRFDSRGYATPYEGTFTICDDRGAHYARGVIVAGVGSVRSADADDPNSPGDYDGILNDHAGDNLDCG